MLTPSIAGWVPAIPQAAEGYRGRVLVLGVTQQHIEELRQALTLIVASNWQVDYVVYIASLRTCAPYDVILAFGVVEAGRIFGEHRITEVLRDLRTKVRDQSRLFTL